MIVITSEGQQSVGSSSSIVEINGNQYDAYSGQLIKAGKKTSEKVKYHTAKVIDGFIRSTSSKNIKSSAIKSQLSKKTSFIAETKRPSVVKERIVHSAKSFHQRTEKSRTLMRGAVTRPMAIAKKSIQEGASTGNSSLKASSERINRAKKIVKHAQVRRFGESASNTTTDQSSSHKPSDIRSTSASVASMSGTGATATLVNPLQLSHQRLERMLDQALAQADAHKQKLRGGSLTTKLIRKIKTAPRWLTIAGALLIVLAISLIFIWQSIPQLAIKVASTKAHIEASLPSYTPSGFAYDGHIVAKTGAVSISYKAVADTSKTYIVTEQTSSQDTSSLVANNTDSTQQVQTSQINGVPVVIVGDKKSKASNKALCVNNGIQTTVQNHANLAPDELMNIAKSICAN